MANIEIVGTSYPDEKDLPQECKIGTGYKEKQGVSNVNFVENSETPPFMSKEEI